jgi:N-acyl-D-amino-acid deacylase
VIDKGTFVDPIQYPLGIEYVFINGIPVVQSGDYVKKLAGNVLRKSGKRAQAGGGS